MGNMRSFASPYEGAAPHAGRPSQPEEQGETGQVSAHGFSSNDNIAYSLIWLAFLFAKIPLNESLTVP